MASSESLGIVEWYGSGGGHRCGYCKSETGNISDGMWSHALTVQNYQDMIDRGWRRSGKYCYKPIMDKTCCPHYTIKMSALDFRMNKSHKKIIKQVNKYLIHGIKPGDSKNTAPDDVRDAPHTESGNVPEGETPTIDSKEKTKSENNESISTTQSEKPATENENAMETSQSDVKEKKPVKKGEGADPDKPPCKKAKDRKLEIKRQKLLKAGKTPQEIEEMLKKKPSSSTDEVKSLEDYLDEPSKAENCAHKLEIKLVRSNPRSQEFTDSFKESHTVYHSYQMKIHGDPPSKPSEAQYTRFLCDSPLEIKLIRSNPRQHAAFVDSYKESYGVFKKYQMSIHHEEEYDCDNTSFDNFLVDSPLKESKEEHKTEGTVSMGYGSFHQHYILDGKIIAVGVIDILPHCISSVYLYYHPDYSFLALGTYSALQEIAFTRSLNKMDKELKYYYMGYYIHSCPKMKYKGQYYPSFLLCPETYTWQPIEKCAPKLDQNRYARFAPEGVEDENLHVSDDEITILFMRQLMTYSIYKQLNPKAKDTKTVKKYSELVGKKVAPKMMLFRSG